MTDHVRQIIAENALLLKGRRAMSETIIGIPDTPPKSPDESSSTVDDDILSVLRDEREAVAGPMTAAELAAFAESF